MLVVMLFSGMSPIQRLEHESKGTSPSRPRWINSTMWRQCQHLESLFPVYDLLCRSINNNHDQWQAFESNEDPYTAMKSPYHCEGTYVYILGMSLLLNTGISMSA